ncbi:MAG TPA: hypothetical protein VF773_16655 [Verrucomicrobiae bacterium]
MNSPTSAPVAGKPGVFKYKIRALTGVFLLVLITGGIVWKFTVIPEPAFQQKSLSQWLDELRTAALPQGYHSNMPPVRAIHAIGTNSIPWLMHELHQADKDTLRSSINSLLDKQSLIKARFLDSHTRIVRATFCFQILGPIAEPAIPELLASVERLPGYIPNALADIGPAAIPALQVCLTNQKEYATTRGPFSPIPGNTIGAIFNAKQRDRLSASDLAPLLPQIRHWSQSTNTHAAFYAEHLLKDLDKTSP